MNMADEISLVLFFSGWEKIVENFLLDVDSNLWQS